MPIGDLLAEITGASPAPSSTAKSTAPNPSRPASSLKRKATEPIESSNGIKTPRTTPTSTAHGFPRPLLPPGSAGTDKTLPNTGKAATPQRPLNQTATSKPANDILTKSASNASKPLKDGGRDTKPAGSPQKPVSAASPVAAAKSQPKKGSFAEIMARGKRFQESGVRVGQITHKPLEKGTIKKEREEAKADPRGPLKKGVAPGIGGRDRQLGNGTANRKPATGSSFSRQPDRDKAVPGHLSKDKRRAEPPPPPKVKKAAVATTGYTGTARPRPGDAQKKKGAPRGGAALDPRPRYGGAQGNRSRYEDDYDEELDDFIEYDDDEEDDDRRGASRGGRYDYDSEEDESDMEAGLDELDEEEEKAAWIARREDLREEREEAARKKAKEERKRLALREMGRSSGRA